MCQSGINRFFEFMCPSILTKHIRSLFAPGDPRLLPIKKADDIPAQFRTKDCIASIRKSAGISDFLFSRLYLAAIRNAAELVQLCPGSEAHHHAWPGGLISHMLESYANSLEFRKSVILPVGSSPEERFPILK